MKPIAITAVLCLVIGFLIAKLVEKPPATGKPEVRIEWKQDSTLIKQERLRLDSARAELSTERRLKNWALTERQHWQAFYQHLADSLQESGGEIEIPKVTLDTLLTHIENDTTTYRDTLHVEYIYPPINTFANIWLGMQPRKIFYKYPLVTVTTQEPEPLPLVKGLFLGSQLSGRYGDGLLDLSSKEFKFSAGLTLQSRSTDIDLVPFDYRLTQNHAEMWYGIGGKFFIWRN